MPRIKKKKTVIMKKNLLSILFTAFAILLFAQDKSMEYYFGTSNFDENIPTPKEFLGWQIGDWHLNHDQLTNYCKKLAESSPKITYYEYARSYEQRPLFYLIITSEKNHANLENIRKAQLQMCDADNSGKVNLKDKKIIIYQGFSVHGNEASGGNAAPLAAYNLAASREKETLDLLDEVVVLLDPCFNPDGFHRFSTWVNSHKSMNLNSDRNSREFNEAFPRGRTNHYWFDLNRDWLPLQHPESRGRIREFYKWRPTILTDHHEMGSDRTFFFQPGEPARTNPLTPEMNQILTGKIGEYHAAELDKIGSFYYSHDGFDDFYYGKGSTYPDALGSIGILFEQASSRGHLQETENGELSFPFTIRNQVKTAISTQKAALGLRKELLTYQRDFFNNIKKDAQGGYVFSPKGDKQIMEPLLGILLQHNIEVQAVKSNPEEYYVDVNQPQSRLIRSMFEKNTTFKDSLFYDVSTWNMPLSFNLNFDFVKNMNPSRLAGKVETAVAESKAIELPTKSEYAYLLDWNAYFAPKALNMILKNGLSVKVANKTFSLGNKNYPIGTLMIAAENQPISVNEIHALLTEVANETGVKITPAATGYTPEGIDLGSFHFEKVQNPKAVMPIGSRVSSYGAGEVWHLLDQRFGMNVTMIEKDRFSRVNLDKYNCMILADGNYDDIKGKIQTFVQNGGTLVTIGRGTAWLAGSGLTKIKKKKSPTETIGSSRLPYQQLQGDLRKHLIGGSIIGGKIDLSHPLAFGYDDSNIHLFKTNPTIYEMPKNNYAAPIQYTSAPQVSGYMSKENRELLKNSPGVIVSKLGRGRIVSFADNPIFRAYWYGTNKLFMNSIFFGNMINGQATE